MAVSKRAQQMQVKRNEILWAAGQLFLSQGYNATRLQQISASLGISTAALLRAYPDKEAILRAFVSHFVIFQYSSIRELMGEHATPLMVYAVKSAIQMKACEISEAVRDLFVSAYTLPSTSDFIYHANSGELEHIFSEYIPELQACDIFELEIAIGSMMRGYMSRKCDMYFPFERKFSLFWNCCLKIFEIPEPVRKSSFHEVMGLDIDRLTDNILKITMDSLSATVNMQQTTPPFSTEKNK